MNAAVVVVLYGDPPCGTEPFEQLLARTPSSVPVFLVENGKAAPRWRRAAAAIPNVETLRLPANRGFAGGVHAGVDAVAARCGDEDAVVALVNPDCFVEGGWLDALAGALTADRTVGLAGALLFESDGVTLQHAGASVAVNGLTRHLGRGATSSSEYATAYDCEYVCGALCAFRMEVWRALGGFDEGYYPAYFEEVDFCARLRARGYRVRFVPEARARHLEGGSTAETAARRLGDYHRNRMRYVALNAPPGRWVAWLAAEVA